MRTKTKWLVWGLFAFVGAVLAVTFINDAVQNAPVGTTITTILPTDLISNSRSTINNNDTALNAGKLEITDFYATTSHSQIASLLSLSTVGTITTGTWSGTAVGATKGGTGLTTYSTGDLIYASAANTLSKRAASSTNEVLTLVGSVPVWSSMLTLSANQQSPLTLNGLAYVFPPAFNASSTVLTQNGSGKMSWGNIDWQLLTATTSAGNNMATATVSSLPNRQHYKVILTTPELKDASGNVFLRFNEDGATNYRRRTNENGTYTTAASSTVIALTGTGQNGNLHYVIDIYNPTSDVKTVLWNGMSMVIGDAPTHEEGVGVWYNETSPISAIHFVSDSSGALIFKPGTTITVYGSGF